ncbi:hypothetical protein QBC47DRAFT_385796, partial [Echria macrotheca]
MAARRYGSTSLNSQAVKMSNKSRRGRVRFEKPPVSRTPTPEHAPQVEDGKSAGESAKPHYQFEHQVFAEQRRLWVKNDRGEPSSMPPIYKRAEAKEQVRMVWVDQGIWADEWGGECDDPRARWKHEDHPADFGDDHIASRPISQFLYQLKSEREALLKGKNSRPSSDINTRAYEVVRDRWEKWGCWNKAWGNMPGMTWLYEDLGDRKDSSEVRNVLGLGMEKNVLKSIVGAARVVTEHAGPNRRSKRLAKSRTV